MNIEKIQIRAEAAYQRPQNLSAYQFASLKLIQGLQQLHPSFCRPSLLVGERYIPIKPDLSDLFQKIVGACSSAESHQDCINLLPDGTLGPETLSRLGFSVTYALQPESESHTERITQKRGTGLVIQGASTNNESYSEVVLTLPKDFSPDLHTALMVREMMSSILNTVQLAAGSVRPLLFERAIEQEGDLYSGQWLLYLPVPDLGKCLPGDIHWEPFHNGILIQTTPHLPDADNPADIAAGMRVRGVLDEFGFAWQSTYAIHGWPPDEEECRYESFITGAPPDRKYRVRCIDFDGYDADRGVLLYAKLFRRLRRQPRQWGLRGWDGPVVNEARRQVRAARGAPIEWHVGLEESAERVRTLLAEYTDIAEAQLKVIYTPLPPSLVSKLEAEPPP